MEQDRMRVYLNGEYVARERALVPVDDRGFLFGDGVYEVVRVANGQLFEAERHWRRLGRSLEGIQIRRPAGLDGPALDAIAIQLLDDNALGESNALVYVQITRGAAVRTHHFPPEGTRPTVLVSVSAFSPPDAVRARGASVITCPDIRWARCDLKTVNLLPNTLAKQRAVAAGADEAVFVRDGAVTEGASTNVFGVFAGEVRTYPATNYILPGVTRDVVLELAAEMGIPVRLSPILVDELPRADELFMTSTTNDVMPIVRVDGQLVGGGRPGPVAQRLYAALAERMPAGAAREATV
jgi:D-alanine transaminase